MDVKEFIEKMKLYRRAFSPSIIEGVLMDLERDMGGVTVLPKKILGKLK